MPLDAMLFRHRDEIMPPPEHCHATPVLLISLPLSRRFRHAAFRFAVARYV